MYTAFVEENTSDQKRLFPASKMLLGNLEALLFPHYDDNSVLADDIGSFIARKIIRIGYDIDSTLITGKDAVPDDPRANESQIFSMFKSLTKKRCLNTHPEIVKENVWVGSNIESTCYCLLGSAVASHN